MFYLCIKLSYFLIYLDLEKQHGNQSYCFI